MFERIKGPGIYCDNCNIAYEPLAVYYTENDSTGEESSHSLCKDCLTEALTLLTLFNED